jgi:hypothetical protein
MKAIHFAVVFALATSAAVVAAAEVPLTADASVADFPRLENETDDAPRLQRAIDATTGGVLYVPAGTYETATTLLVSNRCSLLMHKNAILKAVKPMEFVLKVNPSEHGDIQPLYRKHFDFGLFVTGGRIDGNGLASCMALDGIWHFTMRDVSFFNGKKFGLRVHGEASGCELIAENLYFICKLSGLAGNTGLCVMGSDSHYTDIVVIDYTVGIHVPQGGSNRFTRCHVWGGTVPAAKPGEMNEMLKDSVCFWLGEKSGSIILRDCYADTGLVGYLVEGSDIRIFGCSYFWNSFFKRTEAPVVFKQPKGSMLVNGCHIYKSFPELKIYEGCNRAVWRDMIYTGKKYIDPEKDYLPGRWPIDGKETAEIDLGK